MKIRTVNQLIDRINDDLAWRKKELSSLLSDVNSAKSKKEALAIRSAVLLLYAHWEGFIKNACEYYINFVSFQGLAYDSLNLCFVAMSLKNKIQDFEQTNRASRHAEFLQFAFNKMGERANIPVERVDTQSNLNSEVLRDILISVGIDFTPYSLRANLIDAHLLMNRNNIAHGNYLPISKVDYLALHGEIIAMIEQVNNDIQNSAVLGLFKR